MKKISTGLYSLFWTQFFGALNDNLFKSALVLLITYKNISLFGLSPASMVAFCGGIFILPFFLISATSGQLADKLDKIWLSIKIKEAEVLISLLGALGLFLQNYYLMIFVLFLLGLQSTFFGPIKYALIPRYTKTEHLVFGNALISSGTFLAILLGTIIGGIAAGIDDNYWPLVVLLLSIAFLGLYYARKLQSQKNKELPMSSESIHVNWNFFTSTRDILKLIFIDSERAHLIIGLSWFWFMGAGLLSLLPLIAKNIFHGSEAVATIMLFTFTLGMGIGPFILEKICKGRIFTSIIPLSLILMTLVIFDLAYVIKAASTFSSELGNHLSIAEFFKLNLSFRTSVDLLLLSLFGGMFTVTQFAQLQSKTFETELSRIVAGNNIVNAAAMVLVSILLMIFHGSSFSLSFILGILGFFNVLMSMLLLNFYKNEFNNFLRF